MLYDIWTVFWRDWIVLKRRLIKFILSRMVAPLLYLVAFGWGLGRSIAVTDGTYIDFLVPGILALNSMNISFNSVIPVHAERVYHKSLEEYLVAPIRPAAFAVGKILAAVLRGLLSSAIIVLIGSLFGARLQVTPLLAAVLVINCSIFAEIGFVAAMKVSSYEDVARVNTYILLPMSFLCGTFFATDKLPEQVRWLLEALPLTHTTSLLRSIGAGQDGSLVSVAVLLFYLAGCFCLCLWSMRRLRE